MVKGARAGTAQELEGDRLKKNKRIELFLLDKFRSRSIIDIIMVCHLSHHVRCALCLLLSNVRSSMRGNDLLEKILTVLAFIKRIRRMNMRLRDGENKGLSRVSRRPLQKVAPSSNMDTEEIFHVYMQLENSLDLLL